MSEVFICRFCGQGVPWNDRDYDMGLRLAELESYEAFGHTNGVTPYLICKKCANEIILINKKCEGEKE